MTRSGKPRSCLGCAGNGCFWLFVVGLMAYAWGSSGPGLHVLEVISLVAVIVAGLIVQLHRRT